MTDLEIKGAVFDVDGTLLDTMGIWEEAGARYLISTGGVPEKGLGRKMASMTMEEGARYMKSHYRLHEAAARIIQGVLDIVRDFYFYEAQLKPGAKEFLEKLAQKGIPIAAATSSDRELVQAAFERLGVLQYFEEIFTCSEVGAGKTEPLIYEKAAKRLGVRPEAICVFEDVLYAIRTACRAGFRTAGVYDWYSEEDREQIKGMADFYLTDFTEFDRFWENLHSKGEKRDENSIDNRRE